MLTDFRYGDPYRVLNNTFWGSPLPHDAALDPNSAAIAAEIARQATLNQPIINGSQATPVWAPTFRIVPAGQPVIPGQVGQTTNHQPDIAANGIPVPPDVVPTPDSDAAVIIVQFDAPNGGYMWEIQGFHWINPGTLWGATSLSRMSGIITRSQGRFVDWQFSGVDYKNPGHLYSTWEAAAWGIQGSGLPYLPGVITLRDLQRGHIEHPLLLEVVDAGKGAHRWPAVTRSDGGATSGSATVLAEGMWLAFDPTTDADPGWEETTQTIYRGLRDYGAIITDRTLDCLALRVDPTAKAQITDQHLLQLPWGQLRCLATGSDSLWHPLA